MIESTQLAAFMIGVIALNLTPGPDMAYVMAQGAGRGPRAAIAAALGIGAGTLVHIALAAAGLAVFLSRTPWAFDAVRYVGAAYLLWVAVTLFRATPVIVGQSSRATVVGAFRQGALTNILNPKVALFFIAFLPQFMNRDGAPYWLQSLILGAVFALSGTIVNLLVAVSSGRLAGYFRRNPRSARGLNWLAGSLMCGLAVKLALPRQP